MTDEVARLVLRNNYQQTLALSLAERRGTRGPRLPSAADARRWRRAAGSTARSSSCPTNGDAAERAQARQALTRPELAVLLAYAKLDSAGRIDRQRGARRSVFPAANWSGYFPPAAARERFRKESRSHRLKREIITDALANRVINLAGPAFVARMKEMSGAPAARIVRAFTVADGAFGFGRLKARIDALDGRMDAAAQIGMVADVAEILRRLGLWFITNIPADADLGETVALYRRGMETLHGTFSSLISPYEAHDTETRIAALTAAGAPIDVAEDVGVLPLMAAAPEVALLAYNQSLNLDLVVGAYFAMGAEVGLDRLRGLAGAHQRRRALGPALRSGAISDDLFAGQRALTAPAALAMLPAHQAKGARADGAEAVKLWAASKADALARAKSFLDALERAGELSVAKLTLANSQYPRIGGPLDVFAAPCLQFHRAAPGNEDGDLPAVTFVGVAEIPQIRFFQPRPNADPGRPEDVEQQPVGGQVRVGPDEQEDAEVPGVAHPAVRASDDEAATAALFPRRYALMGPRPKGSKPRSA